SANKRRRRDAPHFVVQKERARLLHRAQRLAIAMATYALALLKQVKASRRAPARPLVRRGCISCYCRVRNPNVGGRSGRFAQSSPLWCERCADDARQLVLAFGGSEQCRLRKLSAL